MKSSHLLLSLFFLSAAVLTLAAGSSSESMRNETSSSLGRKKGKALSVFQVVRFNNDPCYGGTKNGTCYTSAECEQRGGSNSGTCADGFGVCCTMTINCGGMSSENCTYFDSAGSTAGGCTATVCPCNDNICQMRLDFVSFTIAGPSTTTQSVTMLKAGVVHPTGTQVVSENTRCLTDTFQVSNAGGGINPPTICGTNNGEHMYVDTCDNNCNTMAFTFGNEGVFSSIPTRAFSIKVTQYSCEYANLAPSGCTQYFWGENSGRVQSFNYNSGNGHHLANQDQQMCIRRERNQCRICWYAVQTTDFAITGKTTTPSGYNNHQFCCGYTATQTLGNDCVNIPGAQKLTAPHTNIKSFFCGRNRGLVTTAITGTGTPTSASKSICSTQTPFVLAFRSDNWENAAAVIMETGNADPGFTLGYTMDSINC